MELPAPRIIDAHHHLWDLQANHYPWLSDRVGPRMYGDYAAIRRNYLVDDLRRDIGRWPVVASVHVQAEHDSADPERETRWLQQQADRNPGLPQAIVAYADLSAAPAQVEAQLAAHGRHAKLRGIRQMAHQHRVAGMAPHPDLLADPQWRDNLGLLARHGLSFDLQIFPEQADDACALLQRHPSLQCLLVHSGQPHDQSRDGLRRWRAALRRLATAPNLAIKLSGFGMFDRHWTQASIETLIHGAIDIFGPQRALFGSNFPVDGLMRGYDELWTAYTAACRRYSAAERAALFHDNAARLYRLAEPALATRPAATSPAAPSPSTC